MKKIIMLLAVNVLMLGFSEQAMAAFTNGDLIQVIYQTGVNTGNEYVTDLGAVSGLTAAITSPITFNNNNLFGLGTLNNYQVAYYIAPMGAPHVWISSDTTSSASNPGKKSSVATDFSYMTTLYNSGATTAGGYTFNTVPQSAAHSYESLMNIGSTLPTNIGTFTGFQTTPIGEATITGNSVDQYLFYYVSPNLAASGLEVATIRTYSDGHTELMPPVVAVLPPVLGKAFGAASIPLNGSTSLSFTVQNNNATSTLTGVGFSDTLPAGLVVSTPGNLNNTCGGTATAADGSSSVTLSGATLAASASCTLSVNVTGIAAGDQNNTTGNVTSTEGGAGGTASASTTVIAPPTLAEAFNPTSIPYQTTSSLTFTITNPAGNTAALTGVAFADTLPTGITATDSSAPACGGTLTTTAPTGIALSGATIASNSQCQFSVSVTGAAIGNYNNTTDSVTSTNGGTGNTALANLTVNASSTTDFIGTPTSGSIPLYVSFTDTSTNSPTAWLWDFGDGGSSTLKNPVHFYTVPGSYNVSLTATGTGGPVPLTKNGYIIVSSCTNQPVKIGGTSSYYATIQNAFDSTLLSGEQVQVQALGMAENSLTWHQNIPVILSGGYECDFTANPGFTTVKGTLTISDGTVTVEDMVIQ